MDEYICESFATAERRVTCAFCKTSLKYYDKLKDGRVVCLSCSYEKKFPTSVDCLFYPHTFDPTDPELRREMLKISAIDINNCTEKDSITISMPADLRVLLEKVSKTFKTELNELIVAGLSWFCSMCLQDKEKAPTYSSPGLDDVSADVPDELRVEWRDLE